MIPSALVYGVGLAQVARLAWLVVSMWRAGEFRS